MTLTCDTSRISIQSAFIVPAYRTVSNEEGSYEAHCGYNVVAYGKTDAAGIRYEYLYRGTDTDEEIPLCLEEAKAQALADGLAEIGSLNRIYWFCYAATNTNAEPDYVTNPDRPEYN
jgi:hypothetical protein